MGKKYIIELESGTHIFVLGPEGIVHIGEPDVVYGTVDGMQIGDAVINAKPYTEPDLEQVRKEAYKEGREAGIKDGKCEACEAARKIWKYDKGKENSIGYKIGYKKGYIDGLNRISDYDDKIRKEAYEKGFKDAAYNCEETCTLVAKARTEGYNEGQKAGERHGMKLAWEAARKIYDISPEDRLEIFPEASTFVVADICDRYSASECVEKIRQYEQRQEEIKVGDEVIRHYKSEFAEGDDAPSIFLSEEDGYFRCLAFNGRSIMIAEYPKNQYRKTGRHFPEIAIILEKMRGEQDG